ncbi:GNAT family N-acetyltransferase [Paludibacterium yongneupense]|uniref:GNAT family N-acetyltransferase n=1 Tax=Paludibacterium yongneupense TaxID=400061 RepID=UPI0004104A65|nr:GNAT family N-acetyltransferase [Paludibacterium yongneupense]
MREITIRHSTADDIAGIRSVYEGPKAYSGTMQLPFPSLEKWEKRLADFPPGRYSLVAEVEGEIVGQLGLEAMQNPRRKHVASVGMGVKDAWHGQGIGSRLLAAAIDLAENWLDISRIELSVFVDNAAAIALYKKHGFAIEGESPRYAFRNGEYANVYHMARMTRL